MELKNIINTMRKNLLGLALFLFIGMSLGIGYYLLPTKYYAVGSFYIQRSVEFGQLRYFTYEGYYGQQTALSYTNTVIALLESIDLKSQALSKINISPNGNNLRKYSKLINVTKAGPQLITLTIKGDSVEKLKQLWNSMSDTLIETNKRINERGDPRLSIALVSDQPVIKPEYKPLGLCLLVGALAGITVYALYISLKEYLKG